MLSLMITVAALLLPPSAERPDATVTTGAVIDRYLAPPPKTPCDLPAGALGPKYV